MDKKHSAAHGRHRAPHWTDRVVEELKWAVRTATQTWRWASIALFVIKVIATLSVGVTPQTIPLLVALVAELFHLDLLFMVLGNCPL